MTYWLVDSSAHSIVGRHVLLCCGVLVLCMAVVRLWGQCAQSRGRSDPAYNSWLGVVTALVEGGPPTIPPLFVGA